MDVDPSSCFNVVKTNYMQIVDLVIRNLEAIEESEESKFDSAAIDIS